jgi:hypothetical protein
MISGGRGPSDKVVAVQVYPHRAEQTGQAVFEGLMIRDRRWHRAQVDGGSGKYFRAVWPAAAQAGPWLSGAPP